MKRILMLSFLLCCGLWGMREWPDSLGEEVGGCYYEHFRRGLEEEAEGCYAKYPNFTRQNRPDLGQEGKDYYKIKAERGEAIIASFPSWGIYLSNDGGETFAYVGSTHGDFTIGGGTVFNQSKVIFVDFPRYKIMVILRKSSADMYQIFDLDNGGSEDLSKGARNTNLDMFPLRDYLVCREDQPDCMKDQKRIVEFVKKLGEKFFDKACPIGWFGPFTGCRDGIIQDSDGRYGFTDVFEEAIDVE